MNNTFTNTQLNTIYGKSTATLHKYYINLNNPYESPLLVVKSKISAIEEMEDGTAYVYVSSDLGFKSTIPYNSVMAQLGILMQENKR